MHIYMYIVILDEVWCFSVFKKIFSFYLVILLKIILYTALSKYEVHLKSSGNSVLFQKRGKKLNESIYIQIHQYSLQRPSEYIALWQCPKIYCKIGLILDENFFLKTKNFLFSLLCIINIFQHIKMLFHYPVLNMTGFTYPKFNFVLNICLTKLGLSGPL